MARLSFIGIPGVLAATGVTVNVVARTDAAMTWAAGQGKSGSVTLTALSSDGPSTPCYTGSFTISGLAGEPLSQHTATITQSGVSQTVKFRLLPRTGQKYRVSLTTCFDYLVGTDISPLETDMATEGDIPIACWINIDDLCYVDNLEIDDTTGTGLVSTGAPATTLKEFDYAVGWMARLGLIGDGITADRVKLFTDFNHAFQPGNHEFQQSVGLYTLDVLAGSNAYSTTLNTKDGPGKVVWDAIFGDVDSTFRPTKITNLDTVAEPWALTMGPVKFVAPDGVTRGNADTFLGDDQIDDVLSALNSTTPIKVLLLNHPPKNCTDGTYTVSKSSIEPGAPTSYSRLFTTASTSISALTRTNGTLGCCIVTAGDQHNGAFYKAVAAADVGTVAEAFAAWCCGGFTSVGHNDGTDGGVTYIEEGQTYNNCALVYAVRNAIDGDGNYLDPRGNPPTWTRITVYGDEFPTRVTFEARRVLNGTAYSAFSREWKQWLTDNYGVEIGTSDSLSGVATTGDLA